MALSNGCSLGVGLQTLQVRAGAKIPDDCTPGVSWYLGARRLQHALRPWALSQNPFGPAVLC